MSDKRQPQTDLNRPRAYQIRLQGHLDCAWADWFGDLTITLEDDGATLLTGPALDQAALHGLLRKVRDLGIPLLSVNPVEPTSSTAPGADSADSPDAKREVQ